ncbi:glycosyltransferase family 4 protein [Salegentibacter mishustinae]|uniref:Glycosyl transferase family 1 domain-containing protein n=1 Tax=Salegentibacter mishustinae TaxID=270918 RepID=A0A0Q9ZC72_9FLAO|nr:glycosyltransferase [Salegentibacter mishustinae]KRG30646.1 hypothetical protein APR42_01920 [Salegentibacter mishustinae]PNW23535.1 hypothetical protein APB85_01920 [Salegentibacter mishustinae]PZX66613.1 glycosyltransferase involved in cell wall biosynthesis [Salegentibacter mishustinae]GGW83495.1 hypothetical protein GCM10008086_09730 [Salegentibacter mishustinae]
MRINIFTNIAPHYRKGLWEKLISHKKMDFHFYYGLNDYSKIKKIDLNEFVFQPFKHHFHILKNFWFKQKALIWQTGVIKTCLYTNAKINIFLGEMYCISTWIAAIICRFKGHTVIFWGHGFYGNEGKIKKNIRRTFYSLANQHLLYEHRGKNLMVQAGFNPKNLHVIFNSLDYQKHKNLRNKNNGMRKEEIFSFFENPILPTIVFIGRLTPVKRLDMLIQAISEINSLKQTVNLLIIGDGLLKSDLMQKGKKGLEQKWLYFSGACYEEDKIGEHLSLADLCISPGNVGLTAIHSLSFGTPVGTHGNLLNQMPEVEAIKDGYNGFYFSENDMEDLIIKTTQWLRKNPDREAVRKRCYEIIDKHYNPEYQIKVIEKLISESNPENTK